MVAGKKGHKETRQKEQAERTDEKHASYKTPLLSDRRENVIVVHSGSGKKAELDLRVRRFESFARPSPGADGDERLIERPGGTLRVDIGIEERARPVRVS